MFVFLVASLIHFGVFGNDRLGDCTQAAAANMVQAVYPKAKITTNEVVSRWRRDGDSAYAALSDLETNPLGGHTIKSFAEIYDPPAGFDVDGLSAKQELISTVHQYKVAYVVILDWSHAVTVIKATNRYVEYVSSGQVYESDWNSLTSNSLRIYQVTF